MTFRLELMELRVGWMGERGEREEERLRMLALAVAVH